MSHRFSTVRMADLIVMIEDERAVEFGSHSDLMTKAGLYAEPYGIRRAPLSSQAKRGLI